MIIIDTDKAKGIWVRGKNRKRKFLTSFFSPGLQNIKGLSIGMVIIPPKAKGGMHLHDHAQEFWYIISGEGKMHIGKEKTDIKAGQLIYGPPRIEHQIINDSNTKNLKALLILCPAGDESPILEELKKNGGVTFE